MSGSTNKYKSDYSESYILYHVTLPFLLAYTMVNTLRRSFVDIAPRLMEDGAINETNYAITNTLTSLIYGISKYFACFLAQKHSPRSMLITGIFGASTFTLISAFFLYKSRIIFFYINYYIVFAFCGICWPSITTIITNYIPQEIRGFIWSTTSISTSTGTILGNIILNRVHSNSIQRCIWGSIVTYIILLYFTLLFPYEQELKSYKHFYDRRSYVSLSSSSSGSSTLSPLPSSISRRGAYSPPIPIDQEVMHIFREFAPPSPVVTDSPSPLFEEEPVQTQNKLIQYTNTIMKEQKREHHVTTKVILSSIITVVIYACRTILAEWGLLFLPFIYQDKSPMLSNAIKEWEIGGACGILLIGYISDKYRLSRLSIAVYMSFLASIFCFLLASPHSSLLFSLLNLCVGFSLYIPYSLVELVTLEAVPKKQHPRVAALNNILQQIGCICSGLPITLFISFFQYQYIPYLLSVLLFFCFILYTIFDIVANN
ncbi:hypothetical protein WA158_001534 [Blastocystis sp. Blastoise]